jgi:hypothetical protein
MVLERNGLLFLFCMFAGLALAQAAGPDTVVFPNGE